MVNQSFIHTVIIAILGRRKIKIMIKKIKTIICKTRGHNLVSAGQCPFTGIRYDYCERCEYMLPLDEAA